MRDGQLVNLRIASHPRQHVSEFRAQDRAALSQQRPVFSVCKLLPCGIMLAQDSLFPLSLLLSSTGGAADTFPERITHMVCVYVLGGILKSRTLK